jgi:hypothetical protein
MRSSSRSAYGMGRLWFVRLAVYASKAERRSARAIAPAAVYPGEEPGVGKPRLREATTLRASRTLFHKNVDSSGRRGAAGWSGAHMAATFH